LTIEEAFGIVVRKIRKERLLTQDELSVIGLLDRGFISKIERGKSQPTLVTIFELATALGVSVADLLRETELLLTFNKNTFKKNHTGTVKQILAEHLGTKKLIDTSLHSSQGETLLLVDDDPVVRNMLSKLLEMLGYTVLPAVDGHDAVAMYQAHGEAIDLVLMDVVMPLKDGLVARNEIETLDPKARILMMSGYSADSLEALDSQQFIHKNSRPDLLLENIRAILDAPPAESQVTQ
jgi:CheY-like chemotaxis protein/DNA-binding XRE family transcriptional regulator